MSLRQIFAIAANADTVTLQVDSDLASLRVYLTRAEAAELSARLAEQAAAQVPDVMLPPPAHRSARRFRRRAATPDDKAADLHCDSYLVSTCGTRLHNAMQRLGIVTVADLQEAVSTKRLLQDSKVGKGTFELARDMLQDSEVMDYV